MSYKKIIPYINAENEAIKNVLQLAKKYSNEGADELLIYNYSKDEQSRELFLNEARQLSKEIDIPFTIGCYIDRFEDVKKALYTGAKNVLLPYRQIKNKQVIKEAKDRFGNDKLILELDMMEWLDVTDDALAHLLTDGWVGSILIKHFAISNKAKEKMECYSLPIIIRDSLIRNDIFTLLQMKEVTGIASNFYEDKNLMKVKYTLKEQGIEVNTFENKVDFSLLKVNGDGLIPVVAQDYKSGEVLMLAYMNEEAYNRTITTGIMTYYSRSRDELWVKGDTSGNYQYVKELKLDCDNDTILAKVLTLGPACHTGQTTCFHKEIMKKDYTNEDPFHVFQDVYEVIKDRKLNPKEGSYTNYLFDKGIDKILKKCGEESAEIIIAAKNPGAEELRYEISDYLYHMMVLMVECGLDWTDITNELAHRK